MARESSVLKGLKGSRTPSDIEYQKTSGMADELTAEKSGKRTAPQMNIGPNMGRGNKAAKDIAEKEANNLPSWMSISRSPEKVAAEIDAYNEGVNEGKVEKDRSWNKAPMYAKGGKVSSASKRADGCAVRGKTRA